MGFWIGSGNAAADTRERVLRACRISLLALLYSTSFSLLIPWPGLAKSHDDLSVDQLKARVSEASVPDKVHICIQIAEKQLDASRKLYEAGDAEKAQVPLTDVAAFSELARDYSIQCNKHQKQTEISVRAMSRKLNDVLHLVAQADQAPLRDAISRLERVRDDLLASMFPKGVK
jgi:hypothetical protein